MKHPLITWLAVLTNIGVLIFFGCEIHGLGLPKNTDQQWALTLLLAGPFTALLALQPWRLPVPGIFRWWRARVERGLAEEHQRIRNANKDLVDQDQLVEAGGTEQSVGQPVADPGTATPSDIGELFSLQVSECFERAVHQPASQWGPQHASERIRGIFSSLVEEGVVQHLEHLARQAVALGYRASTNIEEHPEQHFTDALDGLKESGRKALAEASCDDA